jgi:Ca2+-binding EF-hand superfamily protein
LLLNNLKYLLFILIRQKEEIVQSSLEKQIEYLISLKKKDIEEKMIRLDRNKDDRITIKDMRSIIEDLLEFPLRHDEYHLLIKQFPQDQYGYIKYKDYLKQIPNQINAEKEEEQKSFM